MAKGQQRSNREKKKPKKTKSEKNKGGAPSPFGQNYNQKDLPKTR
jgi:hypothetical protein